MSSIKPNTFNLSTLFAWIERRDGRVLPNASCGTGRFYSDDVQTASEYGEPGYPDVRGVILANWNRLPKAIYDLLEREGYGCEWSDEWYVCDNSKAWRSSPDGHGWTPSIVFTDDSDIWTADDVESNPDGFLDAYLLNQPTHCMTHTMHVDLDKLGFKLVETDKETGWHPGQTDDPKEVLSRLESQGDVVFDVTSVGQFDTCWQVWLRPHDAETEEDAE